VRSPTASLGALLGRSLPAPRVAARSPACRARPGGADKQGAVSAAITAFVLSRRSVFRTSTAGDAAGRRSGPVPHPPIAGPSAHRRPAVACGQVVTYSTRGGQLRSGAASPGARPNRSTDFIFTTDSAHGRTPLGCLCRASAAVVACR